MREITSKWRIDLGIDVGHAKIGSKVLGFQFLGEKFRFHNQADIAWPGNKNSPSLVVSLKLRQFSSLMVRFPHHHQHTHTYNIYTTHTPHIYHTHTTHTLHTTPTNRVTHSCCCLASSSLSAMWTAIIVVLVVVVTAGGGFVAIRHYRKGRASPSQKGIT